MNARAHSRASLAWFALAIAAILLAFVPSVFERYVIFVIYFFLLNVALAQSWNLVGGFTGLVSLGHVAFIGIGAYTSSILIADANAPIWLSFLAGGLMAALFAFVISFATFRSRGVYFAIGTLVLAEALRLWMINWEFTGGARGVQLPIGIGPSREQYFYLMLGLAVGSTALVMWIMQGKLGLGLKAIRDNEDSARNMGVDVFRTKLTAFLISAFIAGLVGAVHAGRLGAIEPYSIFGSSWTIGIVNIVIIGGVGTIIGPIIGAIFNSVTSELLADYSGVHLILEGVLVILIIRFLPKGLWGFIESTVRKIPFVKSLETKFETVLETQPEKP
jgi:branched-chain amino acid transport system permease protein